MAWHDSTYRPAQAGDGEPAAAEIEIGLGRARTLVSFDLLARLNAEAARRGCRRSALIRAVLERYLDSETEAG